VVEARLNAVYYTNFTTDRGVVPERGPFERSFGTGGYLNEAYLGVVGNALGAEARLRVGNQILRWGGTSFLNYGLNVPNPYQFARIYLPGSGVEDGYKALPMLVGRLEWNNGVAAEAFWKFDFAPDLGSPNGWLGSVNDVYTPGSRALFLSPFVPDADVSVVTPSTPFGSRVARASDRVGDSVGQFGFRLRSPDLFRGTTNIWLYAARFTDPEGVASTRTGTLADLLGAASANYVAGSRYFVDYRSGVGLIGAAADVQPAPFTLLRVEYALRLDQPLQVQTGQVVGAVLAPAATAVACGGGQQGTARCDATLRSVNANQLVRRAGGITAANFGRFFGAEIDAGSRHAVSQVNAELTQGVGRLFGSDGLGVSVGFGGMYVHGYDPGDLALDSQISGRNSPGFATATRWSWGYRLGGRITWSGLPGLERLRATAAWLHDVEGVAPNQMQLFTKGSKRLRLMLDAELGHGIAARLVWQTQLNRNGFGGLLWDRDYVIAALSWRF
jgi:hypothetical protein